MIKLCLENSTSANELNKMLTTILPPHSKPVEDKIMEIGSFEKFLVDKIKVDGKVRCMSAAFLSAAFWII